jgi:hypothetical protein
MNEAPDSGRRVRRARIVLVVSIIVAWAGAGLVFRDRIRSWFGGGATNGSGGPVERVIPAGTRVKVEVFNATDSRGLARTAASVLRDAGFDVVFFGNTSERHDSTLVRDRSNHPEWASAAAHTMAPASIETRADSGRLVDLTVLVGKRWRPPAEPLRP